MDLKLVEQNKLMAISHLIYDMLDNKKANVIHTHPELQSSKATLTKLNEMIDETIKN